MGTGGMGAAAPQLGIQLAAGDSSPVLFFGPPQALEGNIPLVNTGAEKEKIRSIEISAQDLRGPDRKSVV